MITQYINIENHNHYLFTGIEIRIFYCHIFGIELTNSILILKNGNIFSKLILGTYFIKNNIRQPTLKLIKNVNKKFELLKDILCELHHYITTYIPSEVPQTFINKIEKILKEVE